MARPSSTTQSSSWLSDGVLLVSANLVAAVANYLFQATMKRSLSWSEFGYLNSTVSLIIFTSLPLTAASQTMTHHLAQVHKRDEPEKIAELQAASLKLLRRLTWVIFALSALLIYPVSEFLRFPRFSLAGIGLLWIPVILWSALGGSWCSGLSRFRLLAGLLILSAVIRLVAGAIAAHFYPWAESGLIATILSGVAMAAVALFSPHHATPARMRAILFQRTFLAYGAASLAVTFAAYVFLHGDQIIAQRYFPGEELGRYTGAGLLGRAIIWACVPLLTVYFTHRSGHDSTRPVTNRLPWFFLALLVTGVIFVALFRGLLLRIFLGEHDASMDAYAARFAVNILPIGVLQLLGTHCLAARRLPECLLIGLCGIIYLFAMILFGVTPSDMLTCMGLVPTISLLVVGGFMLARHGHFSTASGS
ncbi:MAG: hypothetical protein LV479_01795 [Methylacidiphilales bacterium]|nr:hypothetical protein [Candidatus Methylacidiphilales bacterium]